MPAYERFVFPKAINIVRVTLNTTVMIALLKMGYKVVALVILLTVLNLTTLIVNIVKGKDKYLLMLDMGAG